MKLLSFLFLIAFSAMLPSTNLGEWSFKVKPGGTLNIKLNSSDVIVNTWNRNEVQVSTGNEKDLQISQNSNTIEIRTSGNSAIDKLMMNIPESFNINLRNNAGDFKINGDLKGSLEIKNQGGDVSFNNVYGRISIFTGGGNIKGSNVNGDAKVNSYGGDIQFGMVKGSTSVETGGGNIKINDARKIELVKTMGGNIMIKNASGNGEIYTGGGNIEVAFCSGNITLYSIGGDIRINEAKGKLESKTGAGTIRVKSLKGSIDANTVTGEVLVGLTSETNNSQIISGNGDVRINVSSNFKGKIIARASDPDWWKDEVSNNESIRSDFKVSSFKRNKREQQIEATFEINNGTVPIKIESRQGTVTIRKN